MGLTTREVAPRERGWQRRRVRKRAETATIN